MGRSARPAHAPRRRTTPARRRDGTRRRSGTRNRTWSSSSRGGERGECADPRCRFGDVLLGERAEHHSRRDIQSFMSAINLRSTRRRLAAGEPRRSDSRKRTTQTRPEAERHRRCLRRMRLPATMRAGADLRERGLRAAGGARARSRDGGSVHPRANRTVAGLPEPVPPEHPRSRCAKPSSSKPNAAATAASGSHDPPQRSAVADVVRAVSGPLATIRGVRPQAVEYAPEASALRDTWVALRFNIRAILEHVTLADLAAGSLPAPVKRIVAETGSLGVEQPAGSVTRPFACASARAPRLCRDEGGRPDRKSPVSRAFPVAGL